MEFCGSEHMATKLNFKFIAGAKKVNMNNIIQFWEEFGKTTKYLSLILASPQSSRSFSMHAREKIGETGDIDEANLAREWG